MSKQDRNVYRREDGQWVNKRQDSKRASSLHSTQEAAEKEAKRMTGNAGGGDVSIHGRNGQIRNKDTVKPAKDPRSSKG
jgi:hypothetical protein